MELKFYRVNGNVVDSMYELPLEEIKVGSVDAAKEKHVPHVEVEGNHVKVMVGEVEHPMLENHYITEIIATTCCRVLKKVLKPGEKPQFEFDLNEGEKLDKVYENCNLHGVWVK